MGQEYFINSQELQDKVAELLPSQGGAGSGVDLSASTQIIPIIDLTESAQGSNLRQDLQSSFSHGTITPFDVNNTTTTVINNTGYWKIMCGVTLLTGSGGSQRVNFILNDGATDKIVHAISTNGSTQKAITSNIVEFMVFLDAGDTFKILTTSDVVARGSVRQIADIFGNLRNP